MKTENQLAGLFRTEPGFEGGGPRSHENPPRHCAYGYEPVCECWRWDRP